MKTEEILKILRELEGIVRQRYKAHIKGIFGSYARGEEGHKSDIDILVDFDKDANLFHLVGLSLFLEEKLHIPVDVVPYDSVREEIKEYVFKEAVYL
jgi:predicted nucleotidyltransferase